MMYSILLLLVQIQSTPQASGFILNRRPNKFSLCAVEKQSNNEELLIPEDNPTIDPNTKSISGVTFGHVLEGLNGIYPPNELSKRNAISRSDGYWSFVEAGEEPPSHFTYGEFDFLFFAELLEKSQFHYSNQEFVSNDSKTNDDGWKGKTFLDIGSGTGRLVLGAAALYPDLRASKGLEILPGIHRASLKNLDFCKKISHHEEETVGKINDDEKSNESEGESEDYFEPLNPGMSEIQQALSEMTPEEWKAILGDIELDDDIFESDVGYEEDQNDDEEDEGHITDGDTLREDYLQSSENEDEDLKNIRSEEHQINSSFVLPSDDSLVATLEHGKEEAVAEYFFESLDEFINCTQEEWVTIYGNTTTRANGDAYQVFNMCRDVQVSIDSVDREEEYNLSYSYKEVTGELPLAPVILSCGSFQDPYEYIGDADVIFVFSSCMTKDMMGGLSDCIGRQCKPGTIVITTEFMLKETGCITPLKDDPTMPFGEYNIELVEAVEGWNWITGKSTAHIQRVVKSLWDGSGPRTKPKPEPTEVAYQTVTLMEAGNLTNSDKFMRKVGNNMAFHSISDIINVQNELTAPENITGEN